MKLLVIGATGRTGRFVVEQGLQRGHAITAFARQPQALAGVAGLQRVVQGDAERIEDLCQAVAGQEAVISAVGSSQIARALIQAMRATGVRRVVMTSSRSVVATRPRLPVALAWLVFREAYADLARAEGMLEFSGLDWTIVRATMLTDKPFTGRVHIDFEANATGGDWSLTRADYAMTLLNAVEDPALSSKALGVGGALPEKRR
jgi:putative NADH-flavin reductase